MDKEIFQIGRVKIIFPPDITEDELQFIAIMIITYIHNSKNKEGKNWSIAKRLEDKDIEKKQEAGIS